jgi:hypothetical protein
MSRSITANNKKAPGRFGEFGCFDVNAAGGQLLAGIMSAASAPNNGCYLADAAQSKEYAQMVRDNLLALPSAVMALWISAKGLHDMSLGEFQGFINDWVTFMDRSNGYDCD